MILGELTEEELAESDVSEEEATREIFNELVDRANKNNKNSRPSSTLPLIEFIKWEDVQELMESGALSRDDLATAIEKTGVTVESGDLTFDTVSSKL